MCRQYHHHYQQYDMAAMDNYFTQKDFSAAVQDTPDAVAGERTRQGLLNVLAAKFSNPSYGEKKMSQGTVVAIVAIVSFSVVTMAFILTGGPNRQK